MTKNYRAPWFAETLAAAAAAGTVLSYTEMFDRELHIALFVLSLYVYISAARTCPARRREIRIVRRIVHVNNRIILFESYLRVRVYANKTRAPHCWCSNGKYKRDSVSRENVGDR